MEEKLNVFEGNQLRDVGVDMALSNAENKTENWGDMAYGFLLEYIKSNNEFLAEDVRTTSHDVVPEPPSKRAWGAIFVRANRNKIIKRLGYSQVKNPRAHRTPATLWGVINCSE